MRVDPSEPPCRGRFQTAISCYGPMAAVVNVMVKRRDNLITSCGDERDECKRTAEDASKGHKWHQNRGVALPWEKHGGYLLTGHACVKKTSNRHAVREIKVGPSKPPCRRRLQTAISCFGPKTAVVNVMVKRRGVDHVKYG